MKTILKPWVKLKETIDHEDYVLIQELQHYCTQEDQITLKLELDYKLGLTSENGNIKTVNEFMYFDGQQLIGYIGLGSWGAGAPIEANGMVSPEYRCQGVFKTLSELAIAEWKRRNSGNMLLLTDRKSISGQAFIRETGAQYKHSEYEMYLKQVDVEPLQRQLYGITLRKATNDDACVIAQQNRIYFNEEVLDCRNSLSDNEGESVFAEKETTISISDMTLPEEEEKRGMKIYLAERDSQIIGKVHLQLLQGIGGIYGLGVLPKHRGKGYGRAILIMAIEKLQEAKAREIMLQVAIENSKALNLYTSCGFSETSTMDYYEISV